MNIDVHGFHTSYEEILTKQNSLYYSLLVKQMGKKQADWIWDKRKDENRDDDLWRLVKKYKPKNKLNIIGDLSWGYSEIKRLK